MKHQTNIGDSRGDPWSRVEALPRVPLLETVSPVLQMSRLAGQLGFELLCKRDDTLPFGFGGNKVRKLEFEAGQAVAQSADTLVTAGGVQSNHVRVTAATAARLGMKCVTIHNGEPPGRLTGNARLLQILGAEPHYVGSREEREQAVTACTERLRTGGRRPYAIPIGASTPWGSMGFALAVRELADQIDPPEAIYHSSSSGGTQAGLLLGCFLLGWKTRIVGVSPDDPGTGIAQKIDSILRGALSLLELPEDSMQDVAIEVNDRWIGGGYGVPSPESEEAVRTGARLEGLFLDHTYTAKAFAAMVSDVRAGRYPQGGRIVFWHTGGQPGLLA